MGNKNNAVSYMQMAPKPSKDDPIRQRVKMLNEGVIQPGEGDPAFALKMKAMLQAEGQDEAQLQSQNAMTANDYRNSFQVNEPMDPTKQIPAGDPMSQFLVSLSRGSQRGKMNTSKQQMANQFLQARLQHLQNNPMPSELSLPGTGGSGHAQNMFNWLIGRSNAL